MAKPVQGKVALRYGPLVYNIKAVDQNITNVLPGSAALKPEWRGSFRSVRIGL